MFDTEKTLNDLPEVSADDSLDNQSNESQKPQQSQSRHETEQPDNFYALRTKAERAERERDELMARLNAMEMERSRSSQVHAVEEDEDFSLAPDALAEGKHLTKLHKKLKDMENKIKSYEQKTQQSIMETQLRTQYPDFYQVVSEENLAELKRAHPTIAQTLATAASADAYSAASSAYSIIKELGIAKSTRDSRDNMELLQRNASKPRAAQSASPQRGDSPLSRANEFVSDYKATSEYQEQLRKEMYSSMRQPRS